MTSSLVCVAARLAYALPTGVSRSVAPCCCSANENSNSLARNYLRKKLPLSVSLSLSPPLTLFCQQLLQNVCVPAEDLLCKEKYIALFCLCKASIWWSNFSVDSLKEIEFSLKLLPFGPRTVLSARDSNCCLCSNFELLFLSASDLFCSRSVLWLPCEKLVTQFLLQQTDYISLTC